jgi:hypothetical protein
MRTTTTVEHVSPMVLFQHLCGGHELTFADHEHVILCQQCENLADQIAVALDDLQKSVDRRQATAS